MYGHAFRWMKRVQQQGKGSEKATSLHQESYGMHLRSSCPFIYAAQVVYKYIAIKSLVPSA